MSYAYIKSVYPDFQSNKLYDNQTAVYNSLDSTQVTQTERNNTLPVPFESDEEARFAKSLIAKSELNSSTPNILTNPQYSGKLLETLQNTPTETTSNKDNLRYYNIPLPNVHNRVAFETFEENQKGDQQDCKLDCDSHISHVINCPRCKGIISRQLNLDNDRVKNEEFMEMFSYIVFGVFILLLIDSLKNTD